MEANATTTFPQSVVAGLRDGLASGDAVIAALAPSLRQLLENGENPLLGDEVVASVRGMASDVTRQLIEEWAKAAGKRGLVDSTDFAYAALAREIMQNPAMTGHLHALAVEWQLTRRLEIRHAVDPVLPLLLQRSLAASGNATATLAMQLLASQARFCQAQRRMQLPLGELPSDLLHGALLAMRTLAGSEADDQSASAGAAIRARIDERQSRIELLTLFVSGMAETVHAALSLTDAGAAIFLTALAHASGQVRDLTVLATDQSQHTRLALALRASGLNSQAAAEQLLALHPGAPVPGGLEELAPEAAAAILASGTQLAGPDHAR